MRKLSTIHLKDAEVLNETQLKQICGGSGADDDGLKTYNCWCEGSGVRTENGYDREKDNNWTAQYASEPEWKAEVANRCVVSGNCLPVD